MNLKQRQDTNPELDNCPNNNNNNNNNNNSYTWNITHNTESTAV
jgi:hypothetical protein